MKDYLKPIAEVVSLEEELMPQGEIISGGYDIWP